MKRNSKEPGYNPSPAAAPPSQSRREIILLVAGTLLLCGIYLGKAYNIDDPLTIWTAQRIAAHPADFYGFDVNWHGTFAPMLQTNLNPPGVAYYLAPFGIFSNWHEPALHIALALVAAAFIPGIYFLALRMNGHPLTAAVFALVCPGVFVSMGTVMTDLPMAALWVWAVLLWLRGLNSDRPGLNAAAGVLIGLAALMKYFAASLIPLLFVYTLLSERKRRLAWLLVPIAILGLFELYTWQLYGAGHFRVIAGLGEEYYADTVVNYGRKFMTALTFLGAGAAPALFLAPWLWRSRIIVPVIAAAVALVTVILKQGGWQPGDVQISFGWGFWIQYGFWLLAGVHIIALVVAELWRRCDRDAILCGFWLGGTFFYSVFIYHMINIRVILPAIPVAAILCARQLNRGERKRRPAVAAGVWSAFAASLALSLCVAYADISLANSARSAVERIAPEKRSGRTWFSGHWGFQYYMEARGAKSIDVEHQDFQLGDTVVTPLNATNIFMPKPLVTSTDQSFALPVIHWVTTMRAECGAGFHADLWGPLPFVFCPVPDERYQMIVLDK